MLSTSCLNHHYSLRKFASAVLLTPSAYRARNIEDPANSAPGILQVPQPERPLGAAASRAAVRWVPRRPVLLAGVPACALGRTQGGLQEGLRSCGGQRVAAAPRICSDAWKGA